MFISFDRNDIPYIHMYIYTIYKCMHKIWWQLSVFIVGKSKYPMHSHTLMYILMIVCVVCIFIKQNVPYAFTTCSHIRKL